MNQTLRKVNKLKEEKYIEKPWLKMQAMSCIPETFEPYPDVTYTEYLLDRNVKKYPNELALVCLDYEMTFKELKDHVDRFATALSSMGVKKGDVVATCMVTSIQFCIADLAIPEIGAIHAPISMLDSVDGLVDKIDRTNCKTMICTHTNVKDGDILSKVKEAKKKTELKNIIVTRTEDYSSNPPKHDEKDIIWMTDLLKKYPPNPPKVDIKPKKDLAFVWFTGGTTGRPKGAMLTHRNLVCVIIQAFGSMIPQSMFSLLDGFFTSHLALPISHLYGHQVYHHWIARGSAILMQPDPRDARESIRLMKKYHPVMSYNAPSQYLKLAKEAGGEPLGVITGSGSMPLAPKIEETVEKELKTIMAEAHGLTESSGSTLFPTALDIAAPLLGGNREVTSKLLHLLDRVLTTPGVIPLIRVPMLLFGRKNFGAIVNRLIALISPLVPPPSDKTRKLTASVGHPLVDEDFKVLDEDTGEKIPIPKMIKENLKGEFCVKGPNVMLGYWPEPGSGLDNEGYVHSGDVVKMDEDGRVFLVDRTKDMINVSGYKVYSVEVDDLLYEYPGVMEAATIGVPDPERPGSERVKVFIAPYPEYRGKITEEDIIKFLREKVEPYAVPKSVEFRDELPKSPVEKIFKKQLRDEEIEKMKRAGVIKYRDA